MINIFARLDSIDPSMRQAFKRFSMKLSNFSTKIYIKHGQQNMAEYIRKRFDRIEVGAKPNALSGFRSIRHA
jgi:hypothetical protein